VHAVRYCSLQFLVDSALNTAQALRVSAGGRWRVRCPHPALELLQLPLAAEINSIATSIAINIAAAFATQIGTVHLDPNLCKNTAAAGALAAQTQH
jgi:hypothetical protein